MVRLGEAGPGVRGLGRRGLDRRGLGTRCLDITVPCMWRACAQRRDRVVSRGPERLAAQQSPHGQGRATHRAMDTQRFQRIAAARRFEPAAGTKKRRHRSPVGQHPEAQDPGAGTHRGPDRGARSARAAADRTASPSATSSSLADRPTAAAPPRTTSCPPAGTTAHCWRRLCRSRRRSRLRTTAEPAGLPTTTAARAARSLTPRTAGTRLRGTKCTVTPDACARTPRRDTARTSTPRRKRESAGSMRRDRT